MGCSLFYQLIESPEKYILGILSVLLAVTATIGNVVAIFVLRQPELKSITNRIVTSLCVIGCFSGCGFLPILALNMFEKQSSVLCWLQIPREVIVAIINITSIFNIALFTYDRYILLKQGANYNQHINHTKTTILICMSWFLPPILVVVLYFFPKYKEIVTSIVYFLAYPTGVALYVLLRWTISGKEKKIRTRSMEVSNNSLQTRKTVLDTVYKSRHVKDAKNLNLVMIALVACFLPLACGNVAYALVSFGVMENSRSLEIYYVFVTFIANCLACVHLGIYYKRYPEFKRSFWKLWTIKKIYVENCV